MTTVVAVEHKGEVTFGWDSQVSYGSRKSPNSFLKVFPNSGIVFGFAGSVRIANVLRWMDLPDVQNLRGDALEKWVVRTLVPALSAGFSESKVLSVSDGVADFKRSTVLACVNNRVFQVSGDFAVVREGRGIYSVGSGSEYALGAPYAGADVAMAMRVAGELDSYTGGKMTVKTAKEILND